MLVNPIMMFFCTLIKSRALEKQISVVQGEGFIVTEVTADKEGALGAMKEELKRAGCKITIHGKSTLSAEVDNKIRQVRNIMRSCSCWPSLFPTVLTAALVYFAIHKVNKTSNTMADRTRPSNSTSQEIVTVRWYFPPTYPIRNPIRVPLKNVRRGGHKPTHTIMTLLSDPILLSNK
jgi:hypothetical protein